MNSLTDFLSSPLLDFVPGDNSERPDELDMLLKTLSESDIQLLDSTVSDKDQDTTTDNRADNHVTNASGISCHSTCSGNITNHTSLTSAFATATETDLKRLKDKNKNKNTMKSTVTWINRFETWRKLRGIRNELKNIPPNDLDSILQSFFAEIRKSDGTEYEPECLRVMLSAMDRYLKEKGREYSILKDKAFENCRKVLNGKAIELREKGMGKRKNKSDPLTSNEEEQLWKLKVLGANNPKSLNYTIFYLISQQFGTRGCQEHHQLRLEDLKFVCDPSGKTILVEWVEGITKTRQGGLSKIERRLPQKMFAHKGSRCPIKFLELLISKRPQKLRYSGPLYLRPLESPHADVWYSSQPVGIQTINTYMKNMAKLGNLDITNKKFTNHSIRKTTVCKLQKAGVSNDKIIAVTGHRNEMSLKAYSNVDLDEHKKISSILSDQSVQPSLQENGNSRVEHVPLPTTSSSRSNTALSSAPHYNFSNCTVYFNSATMHNSPPIKKRRVIIDSDSDDE